jgi:hypothetical protein
MAAMEAEDHFANLGRQFVGRPGVSAPRESRGFGSSALKVNGSIFAMLTGGRLVVKLPRDRVDALIKIGVGEPFDAGKGRPMKEWLTVTGEDGETWLGLTQEALDFVATRHT